MEEEQWGDIAVTGKACPLSLQDVTSTWRQLNYALLIYFYSIAYLLNFDFEKKFCIFNYNEKQILLESYIPNAQITYTEAQILPK